MEKPNYGLTKELEGVEFDAAVERTVAALKTEGFGVLTEIDVKATLKKKLDVDFKKYAILGACNPSLAHKALTEEPFIGLVLPCNVIVFETEPGSSVVSAVDPRKMFQPVDNPSLEPVVEQVRGKLTRVLESI
ncbi:MAG: DUF302 domain-containing protein [Deltaproteobacteria bacterium]|nr:DUF302 domain-containing protein [Deltaproteobacteria bacterium]